MFRRCRLLWLAPLLLLCVSCTKPSEISADTFNIAYTADLEYTVTEAYIPDLESGIYSVLSPIVNLTVSIEILNSETNTVGITVSITSPDPDEPFSEEQQRELADNFRNIISPAIGSYAVSAGEIS